MDIPSLIFYAFATVLVLSSLLVISARNPVYSVLFLIFSFFNAAALMVLIGAEYIAMTLVIVYVGAVAVLFLFVVMMIDIDIAALRQGFLKYLPVGAAAGALLLGQFVMLYAAIRKTAPDVTSSAEPLTTETVSNTLAIGKILYTEYLFAFQLSGIILLVAMIGAIVLTLRDAKQVRRQKIGLQVERKRADAISLVHVKSGEGI
jgi:NADH-quinone oxidoreductase subunit J